MTEILMTSAERRQRLLQAVDVVIDGGANCGQYARWIRACGFRGRIVSVEPATETFGVLVEVAAADEDWHCLNVALGAEDGEAELHLTSTSLGSSIFRHSDAHARMWPDDVAVGAEVVRTRSLPSLWDELGLDGLRVYLKLDVEGAELSVLQGAGPVLDRVAFVELELCLVGMYESAPSYLDVLQFLDARGFAAVALEQNHSGDEASGQMIMLDGVFRRR